MKNTRRRRLPTTSLVLVGAITLAACGDAPEAEVVPSVTDEGDRTCSSPAGVVKINGGTFVMGRDDAYPEEGATRDVSVDAFWLDATEVTNAQFAEFIAATGYVTVAQRPIDPALYPNADPAMLRPGSAVFAIPLASGRARAPENFLDWWAYVPGADWQYPLGRDKPAAAARHPVTQIAFEDALAYAVWAGGRLPTEAEWEFAAQAGSATARQSDVVPDNANTWQGVFPVLDTGDDGFKGIAPAGCFAPNEAGLYDMLGNVWEWTADWYAPGHLDRTEHNPKGVSEAMSRNPQSPMTPSRVVKGGSFLCAANYCLRYRPSARHAQDTGMGTNHIGFRVAYDAPPE